MALFIPDTRGLSFSDFLILAGGVIYVIFLLNGVLEPKCMSMCVENGTQFSTLQFNKFLLRSCNCLSQEGIIIPNYTDPDFFGHPISFADEWFILFALPLFGLLALFLYRRGYFAELQYYFFGSKKIESEWHGCRNSSGLFCSAD